MSMSAESPAEQADEADDPAAGTLVYHRGRNSAAGSQLIGKPLDNRGRDLGWMGFWLRRPPALGRNLVVARRRFPRSVAAAGLVLRQRRWASIAGIAAKEPRLRHGNLGGASRALATTGAALHRGSTLGRPISRSRFRGSALAGATKPDLGNHQWPSTNSPSSSPMMQLWRGFILAATAGEA